MPVRDRRLAAPTPRVPSPTGRLLRVAVCLGVLASPAAGPAQSPIDRPVFRSGVEVVEVDVVAFDASGRPVTDLTRDDFAVTEDGRPRDIIEFTRVNLPIPPARPPGARDVGTNVGTADGRVIFLVLDDANSAMAATDGVRAAARALVSRLGPRDHLGLMWVSRSTRGALEFGTNHAAALRAIDAFEAERASIRLAPGVMGQMYTQRPVPDGEPRADVPATQSSADIKEFFDELRPFTIVQDVSRTLARVPHRRKALVYIGEGLRTVDRQPGGDPRHVELELARALTATRRANVSVYLVDPRSPLRPGAEDLFDGSALDSVRTLRASGVDGLASASGGFAVTSGVVEAQVERILREVSAYYLLAYRTEPATRSVGSRLRAAFNAWEGWRTIDVRTTRPGVTVRARKGYWPGDDVGPSPAPAAGAATPTFALVSEVLPQTALALTAHAAVFRGSGATHDVAVVVEVRDPSFAVDPRAGFRDTATMTVVAVEHGAGVRASNVTTATMAIDAARTGAWIGGRYVVCDRLALKPGEYQVRVGVTSATAKASGSVYLNISVPAFDDTVMSASHIVLDLASARGATPVARAATVTAVAPVLPSIVRTFTQGDTPSAVLRVYGRARDSLAGVSIHTTISTLDGLDIAWSDTSALASIGQTWADHRVALPIDRLVPATYRLAMTVRDASGRQQYRRQLDFDVH
jgi:VWFA-related protein